MPLRSRPATETRELNTVPLTGYQAEGTSPEVAPRGAVSAPSNAAPPVPTASVPASGPAVPRDPLLGEPAEPDESSVVSRAPREASSDSARLHALVVEQGHFVTRSLRNLGVVGGELDDCVQKVFLVAARRLVDIEPGKERAFLFSCAQNTAAHHHRSLARKKEVSDEALAERSAPDILPDRLLQQKQTRELLDLVLARMDEGLRAVFVLSSFEEMTMAEVATVLGLPPGTVASRLRRARQIFREQIVRHRSGHSQESA